MKKFFCAMAAALALCGIAQAHTHLKSSTPAEGSVLTAAPANIVLTFSEATRVTALTVQKEGADEQKLTPLPSAATQEVNVPAPKLAPGKYVVTWRALGSDNHIMSGKVQFTVDPAATASAENPPAKHSH